jgi:hypothetical protein
MYVPFLQIDCFSLVYEMSLYPPYPPYPPYLPLRLCFRQVPKMIGFHWCTECPLYPPYPPYLPLLTMAVPIRRWEECGVDQSQAV